MTGWSNTHWLDSAACTGKPSALFFPDELDGVFRSARANTALAICRSCPVSKECLEFAIATESHWGIWGGMLPSERRAHAMRCAS